MMWRLDFRGPCQVWKLIMPKWKADVAECFTLIGLGFGSKGFAVTRSVPSLYLYESADLRCKLIIVRPNLSGKLIRCFCQTIKWKKLIREVDV